MSDYYNADALIAKDNEITRLRSALAEAERERDEAKDALADAGTLMGKTIAMSYCTSAEMPERDHTHALPSAMLRVIRECDAAESRADALAEALRHAARELQYIADDDPCDKTHQSEEGKACVVLAERLLGPMRAWPEEPNAQAALAQRWEGRGE